MKALAIVFTLPLLFSCTIFAGDGGLAFFEEDPFEECVHNEILKSKKVFLWIRYGGISRAEAEAICRNMDGEGHAPRVTTKEATNLELARSINPNGGQTAADNDNRPPADKNKTDPADAGKHLMVGPLFGLSPISIEAMANIISDEETRMFAVKLTASAVAASLIIQSYRLIGHGGRQKTLATIVPPGAVEGWFGRSGFRVPPHEVYSLGDVRGLARSIESADSEDEVLYILQETDPELLAYLTVVTDYVRRAKAIEWAKTCPSPCS